MDKKINYNLFNYKKIRNFCIIAHIDHGKSTLADRILEICQALPPDKMQAQVLDKMDLEREKGITIKMSAITLKYPPDNENYFSLNLIDTPGHVDFNYEVSRSLAACEGALLVIDASQGVEAQTLANAYLAIEQNLEIIPVINKIDLPSADLERTKKELADSLPVNLENLLLISAKDGLGILEVLEKIIKIVPPPTGNSSNPLKALVFDSHYDTYRGVAVYIRVKDGQIKKGDEIFFIATKKKFVVEEVGIFNPDMTPVEVLHNGCVGYVFANIYQPEEVKVGDTLTLLKNKNIAPLPGYREVKPMVFCGLYPATDSNYETLKEALKKLKLNDAALVYEKETSNALGFGFRCGFLGLLHMEIIQQRLEREYNLNLVATAPSVVYKINKKNQQQIKVDNPAKLPPPNEIEEILEPYVTLKIFTPQEHLGKTMDLVKEKRGIFINMEYLGQNRILLNYEIPLGEIILDFFDKLKSVTRGYGSMDYDFLDYKPGNLVKLDILLAGEKVDALSMILNQEKATLKGRALASKLKESIPRHLFEIPIQAVIGGKIIARENIKALRKNVLAKCYGGDITRKRKLLEKQKEGKQRMKVVGKVEIPQEAFLSVLKLEE